ncbi:hypothetical protein DVH24_024755 [Malus domestica]|uniref:Uncharacterized protein n=1 Tax=Malus domestica TaxID=3750 RepID=A0A498JP10_MALDO|nr:hypothetical protein DVH24_024755 [Malus domestica]
MKATLKSSTEKKQPIESTTPNNEVLPKLRSTLSARNIMLGPNYDEEINKTVVSVERLSAMKKHVFGLGSAQEKVVKLSKQLSHLKSLVSRHPDAVTVVTGIAGCAGLKVTALSVKMVGVGVGNKSAFVLAPESKYYSKKLKRNQWLTKSVAIDQRMILILGG